MTFPVDPRTRTAAHGDPIALEANLADRFAYVTDHALYGAVYVDVRDRRVDPARIHAGDVVIDGGTGRRLIDLEPVVAPSAFVDLCAHGFPEAGACPLCLLRERRL